VKHSALNFNNAFTMNVQFDRTKNIVKPNLTR